MVQAAEVEPPITAARLPGLPAIVEPLRRFFSSRGLPAYLVGGVARDALLGRETLDIDIAVAGDVGLAATEAAAALGYRVHALDTARRIFRLSPGHGAPWVDISPLRGSIWEDLGGRDFTIDAMAIPLMGRADLIDPYDGASDLERRKVRALSSGVFEDDPARLLRAVRLSAQLGFDVEPATRGWVKARAGLVSSVAAERVRDELMKLLGARSTARRIRDMDELGLLRRVIPELEDARGVAQPKEHYWDVFDHSIETVGQVERLLQSGEGRDLLGTEAYLENLDEYFAQPASDGHSRLNLVKLAGLLHDISKPATKTVEPSGRIRFLGHHVEGSRVARDILTRLRFSRAGVELVSTMIENHLRPGQMAKRGEIPTRRAVYRFHRDLGEAAFDTVYLNMADYLAARGPALDAEDWRYRRQVAGHILRGRFLEERTTRPLGLVNGHDIMNELGIAPGPRIGEMLEMVREAHASGEVSTKEEALRLIAVKLQPGGPGA